MLRALFGLCCAAMLGGCAAVLIPPEDPPDPQPVFLLDHGRHTSLVLPDARGGLVRYAYGDWQWYAEGRTGLREGSVALLRPSPAALGRRALAGPVSEEGVRHGVRVTTEEVLRLEVPGERLTRLRRELDTLFEQQREGLRYNPAADLEFVPHPEPYSLGNNSNSVVAEWLEQLGVGVRGGGLLARWRIGQ